ncbi:MAG: hypothetical protein AAGJ50_03600 [Pseudomonadota bacterium]
MALKYIKPLSWGRALVFDDQAEAEREAKSCGLHFSRLNSHILTSDGSPTVVIPHGHWREQQLLSMGAAQ